MMKPIAPDIKNPLYDLPPPPPVPDKDNPLYDSPKRPDMPRQTLNPRQIRNQTIALAKDIRQQAMQAARAMQDRAQRQAAKQAAQDSFDLSRNAAQRQYRASRTGISSPGGPGSTGDGMRPTILTQNMPRNPYIEGSGPTGGNMLQPPRPTFDTTMSDDFTPRQNNQIGFADRLKQTGLMKKGGSVKKYKAGGSVKSSSPMKSSASKRADGCAIKGKTRGRIV